MDEPTLSRALTAAAKTECIIYAFKSSEAEMSERTCKLRTHSWSLLDFDSGSAGSSWEDVWGCWLRSADWKRGAEGHRIYTLWYTLLCIFDISLCVICRLLRCGTYLSAVWLPWQHVSSPHPQCPSWSVWGKQRPNSAPPSSQPSSASPFHLRLHGLPALSAKQHKHSSSQPGRTAWLIMHCPNTEYIHRHNPQANQFRLKRHKGNLRLQELQRPSSQEAFAHFNPIPTN